MGILARIFGRDETFRDVDCKELFDSAEDYALRELAWECCVDMVAGAVGRCDFRTFVDGVETFGAEHWLWNVEPNANQNSTMFLHKMVDSLYRKGEALIVAEKRRGSDREVLAVADDWHHVDEQFTRQNEYTGVRVNNLEMRKTYRESDVLHLRLHNRKIRPAADALTASWCKMAALAQAHYNWDRGQHWKIHISQMARGTDDFSKTFAAMMQDQLKPFFSNDNAVLPEWDGYSYERIGGDGTAGKNAGEEIRALAEDIWNYTARAFGIPAVLVNGKVEATADANSRFLTYVIDPLCDQLQEEILRKRYGYDAWSGENPEGLRKNFRVDTSAIMHFDIFGNAANFEKLLGSGVSYNDICRAAGRPTVNDEWADEHFLTKNIGLVREVLETAGESPDSEGGN